MRRVVLIMLLGVISVSNATMVADGVELVSNQSWTTGNVIDARFADVANTIKVPKDAQETIDDIMLKIDE